VFTCMCVCQGMHGHILARMPSRVKSNLPQRPSCVQEFGTSFDDYEGALRRMGVNVQRRKRTRARAATGEEGVGDAEGSDGGEAGGGADDGGPGAEGDTVDSEIRELLDEVASESSG